MALTTQNMALARHTALGPGSNLRDKNTFPPFWELFNEHEIPSKYYQVHPNQRTYGPRRHWCFIGEIKDYNSGMVRLLVNVRDTDDDPVPVFFHTDDRGAWLYDQCKEGHTLVVLYPKQHVFAFGPPGFRIEEGDFVKVIPHSLEALLAANDKLFSRDRAEKCDNCGKSSVQLSRCARCQVLYYCGKECQTTAWKRGHKTECKVLNELSWFTNKNWERFEDFYGD